MPANTVVRARIDERTKNEAAAVLDAIGLTVSDAFRLMMVRIAKEKALPFEPLVPNDKTVAAIKEARGTKLPRFATVEALFDDLNDAGD
ncbi:MAG TPA: type II toxin-antitoxin system RelB/DinJ family antitoxin [Rhizomicrobium sp.]|jgi:DNA-damage-inducible protein J